MFTVLFVVLFAGLLTVLFRMDSKNPEGVMYSIALVNIIAPLIDRLITGRTTDGHSKKWVTIGALVFSSTLINTAISIGNVKAQEEENASLLEDEDEDEENSSSSEAPSNDEFLDPSRGDKLFGIENATYKLVTLGDFKEDSHIKQVYVAIVNETETAYCYELYSELSIDAGEIKGTLGISFDLSNDKVLTAKAIDMGTASGYKNKANKFVGNFVGVDAATIAAFTSTSHDGFDTTANATYSTQLALDLVIEAAQQYVNTDKNLYGGNE